MANLVLVDDNRALLNTLSNVLENAGHKVTSYVDPDLALRDISGRKPDMALVDVRMPRTDGLEMLRRIRETSDMPVMFLSPEESEVDEVLGLRMGADDFVSNPFAIPRIVVERVSACLRRCGPRAKPKRDASKSHGPLSMDRDFHLVTWRGHEIALTATEFKVLWTLLQRPGMVFSRSHLMQETYDDGIYVTDRSIDSQIKRLRIKFRAVDQDFDAIETLYGLGYRLILSPETLN